MTLRCHTEYHKLTAELAARRGPGFLTDDTVYTAISRNNRELNPPIIQHFIEHLDRFGFRGFSEFFQCRDEEEVLEIYLDYLTTALPDDIRLHDGFGERYDAKKSTRFLLAWALRSSVIMTIQPSLRELQASSNEMRWATALTHVHVAMANKGVTPPGSPWEVLESLYRGLEGSYRSRAALEVEEKVREAMRETIARAGLAAIVEAGSSRQFHESYDLACAHGAVTMLGTVKSRGSLGGCHSSLYRRDVQGPLAVAAQHGHRTLAVFIGRNWPAEQLACAGADAVLVVDAKVDRTHRYLDELRRQLDQTLPLLLDPDPAALARLPGARLVDAD